MYFCFIPRKLIPSLYYYTEEVNEHMSKRIRSVGARLHTLASCKSWIVLSHGLTVQSLLLLSLSFSRKDKSDDGGSVTKTRF